MINKYDELMELVSELIKEGYKITSSTLLDIKREVESREITIVYTDSFKLYFNDGKMFLETTFSGRMIDDEFITQVSYLNMIKNQFNQN